LANSSAPQAETSSSSSSSSTSTTATPTVTVIPTPATPKPVMSGPATPLERYFYPTPISWGYPHLEVLVPSKNATDAVYSKRRGLAGTNTTWYPTDGTLEIVGGEMATFDTSVAAITRDAQHVDIFIVGESDSAVYHKFHTNTRASWGPSNSPDVWEPRRGIVITAPTAITWSSEHIDLFALAATGQLFQQTWPGTGGINGWTQWIELGGTWAPFVPTAITWGVNRIDVFLVDESSKDLYHTFGNGESWQPFESLGGYCTSRPVAVSRSVNHLDVFVRGGDAGLWHISYDTKGWGNFTSISGNETIQGEPEAISPSEDRVDVFAWSSDGALLHKSLDILTGLWTPADGFETLGADLGGPPKAVVDAPGSMHVVWFSSSGAVQHISSNSTTGATTLRVSASENLGTPPNGI
jgi:hypothetical protein